MKNMRNTLIFLGILLVALIASLFYLLDHAPQENVTSGFQDYLGVGGDFELINQDGVTENTNIYNNKYKLIYFGFTFCPSICPTELQKIAGVMQDLPTDIAKQIQPMFVTLDPERDTAWSLREYLELFNADIKGYTGTVEQIEAVKDIYKIYSSKVFEEGSAEYTIDHSSYIYFLSPDMKLLNLYKIQDDEDAILQSVQSLIKERT